MKAEEKTLTLLPAKPGTCPTCATKHDEGDPHNADSVYYQYAFYGIHGRWPTWTDALAHCSDEMKAAWTEELAKLGITV